MAKVPMQRPVGRVSRAACRRGVLSSGAPPHIIEDLGRGLSSGIPEVAASGRKS